MHQSVCYLESPLLDTLLYYESRKQSCSYTIVITMQSLFIIFYDTANSWQI